MSKESTSSSSKAPTTTTGIKCSTDHIYKDPSQWKDFMAGFLSGLVSITATYPLHKIMFRQMRDGLPLTAALHQVRNEGAIMLYRGLLSPLTMRAASLSIMFGSYGSFKHWFEKNYPGGNFAVILVLSATLAGISEACFAVPFERVQTLLLDKKFNDKFHNTMHAVRHLVKKHPVKEFYRGATPIMFRNSLANCLFFTSREQVNKCMPEGRTTFQKFIVDFINGGLIGAFNSTVYYPVNVVKTRMQSRLGGPFESPKDVFMKIYNERDRRIRQLYRGVSMNYTRSMLSWGITNATFGLIRKYLDDLPRKES